MFSFALSLLLSDITMGSLKGHVGGGFACGAEDWLRRDCSGVDFVCCGFAVLGAAEGRTLVGVGPRQGWSNLIVRILRFFSLGPSEWVPEGEGLMPVPLPPGGVLVKDWKRDLTVGIPSFFLLTPFFVPPLQHGVVGGEELDMSTRLASSPASMLYCFITESWTYQSGLKLGGRGSFTAMAVILHSS